MPRRPRIEFHALTTERWGDFEQLFGSQGACGGCWCMLWRLSKRDFEHQKGDGNRQAMKELVDSGNVPGLLAYSDGQTVGWCSVSRREDFPALARSRVAKPIDDQPVWSVSCLFVAKQMRGQRLSVKLLKAAVDYVAQQGGRIVEGYPVEPKSDKMPDVFAWTGIASAFLKAGFVEAARGSTTRPIMRFEIARKARSRKSK